MTRIERIEHIGIMVRDMDRSIEFYRDVLGLALRERRSFHAVELAFLHAENDSAEIELIAGEDAYRPGDGTVNHLAFTVTDLEPLIARLQAHSVPIDGDGPIDIWDGMRVLFFRGPDGEKLELFERSAAAEKSLPTA